LPPTCTELGNFSSNIMFVTRENISNIYGQRLLFSKYNCSNDLFLGSLIFRFFGFCWPHLSYIYRRKASQMNVLFAGRHIYDHELDLDHDLLGNWSNQKLNYF
jgi:hypothetical protein